eukprot:TRINITY_DN1766_c0_g1_i1.p1 TRINITY_DN1766_c0_g1~~TRINITY_DN1766_c0_g1_i1.p1  ORF type:complete len:463 (-),score=141.05 TRINITY_DN1766_c0_g1_i1:82-1332(-)
MKKKLQASEVAYSEVWDELVHLRNSREEDLDSVRRAGDKLKQDYDAVEADLRQKLEHSKKQFSEQQHELRDCLMQLDAAQSREQAALQSLDSEQLLRQSLQTQLEDAQRANATAADQLRRVNEKLHDESEKQIIALRRHTEAQRLLTSTQDQLRSEEQQNALLQQHLTTARTELADEERQLQEALHQIDDLTLAQQRSDAEVSTLTQQLQEQHQRYDTLRSELQATQEERDSTRVQLESAYADLHKVHSMTQQYASLRLRSRPTSLQRMQSQQRMLAKVQRERDSVGQFDAADVLNADAGADNEDVGQLDDNDLVRGLAVPVVPAYSDSDEEGVSDAQLALSSEHQQQQRKQHDGLSTNHYQQQQQDVQHQAPLQQGVAATAAVVLDDDVLTERLRTDSSDESTGSVVIMPDTGLK